MSKKPVRFGEYEIIEGLGEGGMCLVFRARHPAHEAPVALKLLREDQRNDPRFLEFFVTEADLSLLLEHENLIRTLDAGEVGGRYYIAMELMDGANLRELSEELDDLGIVFPPDLALYIASEVLHGLEALHTATAESGRPLGLVHRDVTPHNVFLSRDGRVVLGDFGVAHIQAYGTFEPGVAMGKIEYLAPEAIEGQEVDRRADLFALGLILYELLTGERPYADLEEDEEVLNAILSAKFKRPSKLRPSVSKDLESVLLKILAKKPKDRFGSALETAQALEPHWSAAMAGPEILAGLIKRVLSEELS